MASGASSEQSFMSSEALAKIPAALRPIDLQPGDVLIHQGEPSDAASFSDSGSLLVYVRDPRLTQLLKNDDGEAADLIIDARPNLSGSYCHGNRNPQRARWRFQL